MPNHLLNYISPKAFNEDIAIRTYTTRILGSDSQLVLHGGGNTSVKTSVVDALGDTYSVLLRQGVGLGYGRN